MACLAARATNSEYPIGTGAFTSIMLLQLMRDCRVHLTDPVEKYVGELKSVRSDYPDAAPLTLMQLALHTSGLDMGAVGANTIRADGWEKRLIAALPSARYAFEPGTHAAASPLEDAVLALALSRAANRPYDEYVQERILEPLGMSHSRFGKSERGLNPVVQTPVGDLARFAAFEESCSIGRFVRFRRGLAADC